MAETRHITAEQVASIEHQPATTGSQCGGEGPASANVVPMTKVTMTKNEVEYPAQIEVLFAFTFSF
jgi:hypothetical protein